MTLLISATHRGLTMAETQQRRFAFSLRGGLLRFIEAMPIRLLSTLTYVCAIIVRLSNK